MTEKKQSQSLSIYAVYDKVSDIYDTPFFARDNVFARRRFILWTQEEGTMLNQFSGDFELHHVGEFFPATGHVEKVHEVVCEGDQIIQKQD